MDWLDLAVQGTLKTNKYHWCVFTVIQPHWGCPRSQCVCFPSLHCSGSRLFCQELSDAGPGLHALHRSKPLRFSFLGSPQRGRLCLAGVFCPSQVRAAQETRCLASAVTATFCLLCPCRSVFWVYNKCVFSGVPCVSSREHISGCDPPSRCRLSRIARSLG